MGGTMRLGADPIKLHDGTRAREIYGEAVIYERHRHRYEVNNFLRRGSRPPGSSCSGTSPDERLVEIIELADHPFFVASQFHPEFKSRPERPAPLFREFVGAALGARAVERRPERARGRAARPSAGGAAEPRAAPRVRPASEAEKARLNETFAELCRIPSPFGHERALRRRASPPSCAAWASRSTRTTPPAGRRRVRQPARAHPRARRAHDPAVRPPRHGRAERRRSSRCSSTAAGRTRNDGDPRRRQQGRGRGDARGRPPRARRGLARSASSCCSPSPRRTRCAGAKAFDAARAARRLRLRVRPRDADRRGRRRLADLLPRRRPSSTAAPPTPASAPRTAAARSSPPRTRSPRCRTGGIDDRDDRQRRLDPRRRRRPPTSSPERCRAAGRGPLARRRRASRTSSPRWSTRVHDGAAARRVRRRRRSPSSCSTATASKPSRARGRRRRGRAARLRLRAAADRHRRRRRTPTRSRPHGFPCVNLANGTERNHEPTERVSRRRAGGRCSTSRSRCSTRPARRHELPASSASAPRPSSRASSSPSARGTLPPRGRRGGRRASSSRHPGAVGVVALDGEQLWLVRQPREAIGVPDLLEMPAGKLDVEGEDAARDRQARARRGDRQGGRALGAAARLLHLAGLHRRGGPPLPRHRALRRRRGPRSRRTSASTIESRPLAELDALIDEVPRLQDADRRCSSCATACAR